MKHIVPFVCLLLTITPTFAGKLYIHNTTDQPIQFRFIPQAGNGTPDYNYSVAQNSIREIVVNKAMFDGKSIYAIEGETNFGGDSCFNLYAHKNYRISFEKFNLGTTCKVKGIKTSKRK